MNLSQAAPAFCAGDTGDAARVAACSTVAPSKRPDWDSLLAARPDSSFFHRQGWGRVLEETYGHRPAYFCNIRGSRLENLFAVMEVYSRWTGRRGVSLPFTDLCPALDEAGRPGGVAYEAALDHGRKRGWRYLECRSGHQRWAGVEPSLEFYGHVVSLEAGEQKLFKGLRDSVRRALRKAEEAGLDIEFSTGLEAMRHYYQLHCQTRQRHGVPPQPFAFFQNITRHILEPGQGWVVLARLDARPVAGAVFLHHGAEAVFKFGASDPRWQNLRPNTLVMWEAIRHYARQGLRQLHFGRTSLTNEGLRRFKSSFGAREEKLAYYRFDLSRGRFVADRDRAEGWVNKVFGHLPLPLLKLAGRILYPHLS